jgi:hypothetical protein
MKYTGITATKKRKTSQTIYFGKQTILFFVLLLSGFVAHSQEEYRVEVKEFLSVRNAPNAQAKVIGKLPPNHTVYVHEIRNGWATIQFEGKKAYVNSKFLTKIVAPTPEYTYNDNDDMTWSFFYGMLAMLVLFLIISMYADFDSPSFLGFLFKIICLLEIVYYFGFNYWGVKDWFSLHDYYHPLWFTDPNTVGLLWGIVNSFVFYFVAVLQIIICIRLIDERCGGAGFGFMTAVLFVIAYGLTEWLARTEQTGMIQTILVIAVAVCQAIQFVILLLRRGGAISYIICATATILVYLQTTGWFLFMLNYIAR